MQLDKYIKTDLEQTKKMYNIIFTLGDLYDNYEEYQFQSNYDVDDMFVAYRKASKILNFDFCKECCTKYNENYITRRYIDKLLNYKIIKEEDIVSNGIEDIYLIPNSTDFLEIFIKIVRIVLLDFILEPRIIKEHLFFPLDGAAYGVLNRN